MRIKDAFVVETLLDCSLGFQSSLMQIEASLYEMTIAEVCSLSHICHGVALKPPNFREDSSYLKKKKKGVDA